MFPKVYVNTFGVGAPLAGLPVYAVLDLFVESNTTVSGGGTAPPSPPPC